MRALKSVPSIFALISIVILSGCSAPDTPPPAASSSMTTSPPPPSMTFEDGADLPAGARLAWRFTLNGNNGWVHHEGSDALGDTAAPAPGTWGFMNEGQNCAAVFQQTELTDAESLSDIEASDAVLTELVERGPVKVDPRRISDSSLDFEVADNSRLETRQYSAQTDQTAAWFEVRAFPAAGWSLAFWVMCDTEDDAIAASEVVRNSVTVESS